MQTDDIDVITALDSRQVDITKELDRLLSAGLETPLSFRSIPTL